MLGAQALRTKQKVEQKEKERRLRERQKSIEIQREKIQRIADEDTRNAVLAYVTEHEGPDSSSCDCNDTGTVGFVRTRQRHSVIYNPVTNADLNVISMQAMEWMAKEKIQQRHSLNANSLSFIPSQQISRSARHSIAEKKRTSATTEEVVRKKSEPAQPTPNRFLRWIGFSCTGKETEKRKIST